MFICINENISVARRVPNSLGGGGVGGTGGGGGRGGSLGGVVKNTGRFVLDHKLGGAVCSCLIVAPVRRIAYWPIRTRSSTHEDAGSVGGGS